MEAVASPVEVEVLIMNITGIYIVFLIVDLLNLRYFFPILYSKKCCVCVLEDLLMAGKFEIVQGEF